jgi:hypothetical protein
MCGANQQQQQISDAQQQMYNTLTASYQTAFGQSQAITSALTAQFMPIMQAGPSQTGYSQAELNALNTQATQSVATNYAQAQRATAQALAAQGGGNTLLPNSISANLLAQNTNAAAAQRTSLQNTITQNNYAQGYQNWNTAASVLNNTAGLLNPNAYASSATSAGTSAANTANQIAQQNNSIWNAAIGALGSVGGAALGGYMGRSSSIPYTSTATNPYYNQVSTVATPALSSTIPFIPTPTPTVTTAAAGGY